MAAEQQEFDPGTPRTDREDFICQSTGRKSSRTPQEQAYQEFWELPSGSIFEMFHEKRWHVFLKLCQDYAIGKSMRGNAVHLSALRGVITYIEEHQEIRFIMWSTDV